MEPAAQQPLPCASCGGRRDGESSRVPVARCRGYTGGKVVTPATYETVTSGDGHSEAVRVWYDPESTRYERLLSAFFDGHEPRWPVRNKARSVIFWHDEEQRDLAEAALAARSLDAGRALPVSVEPADGTTWWEAEEWQQQYLDKLEREEKEDDKTRS